jgi:lysine N6-hydroxylase
MMTTGFDVVGVGVGPFNLSLAALLCPLGDVKSRFFERAAHFEWHPGMMLAGSCMQTSFLKDLVTPADPTSRFGFLSYLVERGQFYRFLNAEYPRVLRVEFASYLRWVADQLPNLRFGCDVKEVAVRDGQLSVRLDSTREWLNARNLVIGAGLHPHVPRGLEASLGRECFHSSSYLHSQVSVEKRRVAIVGGGQSSAEICLDLLSGRLGQAASIDWITRRANLSPLDETAFTNEFFTPDYVRSFHRLPEERRRQLVPQQKLAGDGISPLTLNQISQRLYELECIEQRGPRCRILPEREVRSLRRERGEYRLFAHNAFTGQSEALDADVVILATGYRYRLPECLEPIAERMPRDAEGNPRLREDFSVIWDGPPEQRVYMQNAGRCSHGIADAQLSLAAWRSAVICNSLVGRRVYSVDAQAAPIYWHAEQRAPVNDKASPTPLAAQPLMF